MYWNPNRAEDVESYRAGRIDDRDIFITAVPPTWKPDSYVMDITGRFDPSWFSDQANGNPLQYPDCEAYRGLWQWSWGSHSAKQQYETVESPRTNTICLQRYCRSYEYTGSVASSGYTRFTISKGHNGDRVYPGCADARQGLAMYLEPVDYTRKASLALVV